MNHKKFLAYLLICILPLVSRVDADVWNVRERSVGEALAYQHKTSDDAKFEGTKLFIDGRYFLSSQVGKVSEKRKCCALPSQPEHCYGLLDAQLRFGFEGTGLDDVMLDLTPYATSYKPSIQSPNDLRATSDLVEWGAVRLISDDPLDVGYYLEFSLFRAGRSGIYQWNSESPAAGSRRRAYMDVLIVFPARSNPCRRVGCPKIAVN